MRCYWRLLVFAASALLNACNSGGSTGTTTTLPRTNPLVNASTSTRYIQLGLQPTSAELPIVSNITGTLLFPAVGTPTAISLTASVTAPEGVADSLRYARSGTLTVYEYVTIVSPITVSLPAIPAITLHFPASTPFAGKRTYYGISDRDAQGGLVSFNTQGPGTIDGHTVSFAQVPTVITFEAGHKYTFIVYAIAQIGAGTIYVLNNVGEYPSYTDSVTTYDSDGTQTSPTITAGLSFPLGIAVDTAGKIYVANAGNYNGIGYDASTVTTYNVNGTESSPTITAGLDYPEGVAVDAAGKIYVVNAGSNTVTTYNANGSRTAPTITAGVKGPTGVAVDAAGKIYVANASNNSVTTYNANGTQTTPTITALNHPAGVAVDAAGQIYVVSAYSNAVTTYNANGSQINPTITVGVGPTGVAVDAAGKIYVVNGTFSPALGFYSAASTYNADGTQTAPTITASASDFVGIAVH
jgi:YVTN family beta-propeller protein